MNTPSTKRPVNATYLVVGLVFLGLAGAWVLRETGVMDSDGFQWLLPLVLVVAGAAGLVATVAKSMTRNRRSKSEHSVWDDDISLYDEQNDDSRL
jgi:hypothetical protein